MYEMYSFLKSVKPVHYLIVKCVETNSKFSINPHTTQESPKKNEKR